MDLTRVSSAARSLPPWLVAHRVHRLGLLVDHTLLRPEVTETDVVRLCDEAASLGLGAVCVNGQWLGQVVGWCSSWPGREAQNVRVVSVAGFPLGASGTAAKVGEIRLAVEAGADEVDAVISLGWAKAGQWGRVRAEVGAMVEAAGGRPLKAILETAALAGEEIRRASSAAVEGGARWVKTSTGFHPAGGATLEAVRLMRETVGLDVGVKASGGIRTAEQAVALLLAGADRIGTSSAAGWVSVCRAGPRLGELMGGGMT